MLGFLISTLSPVNVCEAYTTDQSRLVISSASADSNTDFYILFFPVFVIQYFNSLLCNFNKFQRLKIIYLKTWAQRRLTVKILSQFIWAATKVSWELSKEKEAKSM